MDDVVGMDNSDDDTVGERLDPKLVHEGCMEEMQRFQDMEVYEPVFREQPLQQGDMDLVGVR